MTSERPPKTTTSVGPPGFAALRRRTEVLSVVFGQIETQLRLTNDREAARDFAMDVRLAWLTGHVGNVASHPECAHNRLRVAAVTMAWLEAMDLPTALVHTSIAEEQWRQRELFADKNISFAPDEPLLECWRRLRELVKGLGGVAQAVDGLEMNPRSAIIRNRLMAELVQVAAVAIAWLETSSVGKEIFKTENKPCKTADGKLRVANPPILTFSPKRAKEPATSDCGRKATGGASPLQTKTNS